MYVLLTRLGKSLETQERDLIDTYNPSAGSFTDERGTVRQDRIGRLQECEYCSKQKLVTLLL
jgi:hypothetical protein